MSIFGSRKYKLENAAQEPVIYLSKLMKLEQHVPFISDNKDKVLPILTGALLYRQLSRFEQNKVLPMAKSLGNEKFLGSIQVLLAQNIANPNWNKWCLSDSELRSYFETNKFVSELISTYFFTIEFKAEFSSIVSSIFGVATVGVGAEMLDKSGGKMTQGIVSYVSQNTGLKIQKNTISKIGRSTIIVMILASVMKMMSDSDLKMAKEELLRRGLLEIKDL